MRVKRARESSVFRFFADFYFSFFESSGLPKRTNSGSVHFVLRLLGRFFERHRPCWRSEDGEAFHVGLFLSLLRHQRHRETGEQTTGIGSWRAGRKGTQALTARLLPLHDEVNFLMGWSSMYFCLVWQMVIQADPDLELIWKLLESVKIFDILLRHAVFLMLMASLELILGWPLKC